MQAFVHSSDRTRIAYESLGSSSTSLVLVHGWCCDGTYWDLQIAFFSGLPDTRISRMRWDIFRKQLAEQRPEVLVRREGGKLEKEPDFLLQGDTISFDGDGWEEVPGFQKPWHVYRRAGTH